MIHFFLCIVIVFSLAIPASALEIEVPQIPPSAEENMPDDPGNFSEALHDLLNKAFEKLKPVYGEALEAVLLLVVIVMGLRLAEVISERENATVTFVGCCVIASTLLSSANTMIHLAAETVQEITDYGMILVPAMTTALAAQGGITSSAALYAGTALFDSVISRLISSALIPLLYVFLALAIANAATGEDILKNISALIKRFISWLLKILTTGFTTYMSITGVISGTTDAAALKATKTVISSVVPVVGGILSDSSEAILISAQVAKNTAGIYGIFAVLAIFLSPFLEISVHYLLLKTAAGVCGVFGGKKLVTLIDDFSSAMGILLAMTGVVCILFLVSTICFMKGMN